MKLTFVTLVGLLTLWASVAGAQSICPGAGLPVLSNTPLLTSAQVRQLVDEYYAAVRSLDPDRYATLFALVDLHDR